MKRLAPVLLLLAGCSSTTGLLLEVSGPSGVNSTVAGIATLELVMGHPSYCGRWVEDQSASHTKVDVHARDLDASPYDFLVEPVHATDIKAPVVPIVLARAANGEVLGEAGFGALGWSVGDVRKYAHRVELLARATQPAPPSYVASDGCVCLPGQPWMGTGSGSGCDPGVIPSVDRLADTQGCELPAGSAWPSPVCDGRPYPGEIMNRGLPCFASVGGGCRVDVRNCHDDSGYAYDEECTPDAAGPTLPSGTLCDAYLACETPCADVIGCFEKKLQALPRRCTLRLQLDGDGKIVPCSDGRWELPFDAGQGGACVATILEGTAQPPFTLGWKDAMGAAATTATCPPTFVVDSIDPPLDQVPYAKELYVTVGDHLIHVHLDIVVGCTDGTPSLTCP